MASQGKFQAIKGVRDILPPDSALWNRVEQTARAVFESFGFGEIRLPIFEQTELFARSIGAETDVVSKEMYQFEDRPFGLELPEEIAELPGFLDRFEQLMTTGEIPASDTNRLFAAELKRIQIEEFKPLMELTEGLIDSAEAKKRINDAYEEQFRLLRFARHITLGVQLALRPEATASVCRAYIEHGMHTLPGDVKLYYIGQMFRRERPQKGRYRQFYQIGAEVLSASDNPRIDADVLEMLMMFLERLELKGAKLYLNSIGCKECRPAYVEKLREALRKVKDQLGADSQRRIETNPLRVLDSKLPEEQAIIEKLPRIKLCDECKSHFDELERQLNLREITYKPNWRLVRGLDYYMGTTFEITAPGLGSQDAICGGGRYDGLVELLGGPPTKGIGFAIGTDRLILSLQQGGGNLPAFWRGRPSLVDKQYGGEAPSVFIAWSGKESYGASVKLARRLRAEGFRVEVPADEMKFRKSLSLANRLAASWAVIIGGVELESGVYGLKDLSTGVQYQLNENDLVKKIRDEESHPHVTLS